MKKILNFKLILASLLVSLTFSGCVNKLINSKISSSDLYTDGKVNRSDKPVLMFLLDGSGSMNEYDLNGNVKIQSAKNTVSDIVSQLDRQKINLGLIAFNNGCDSSKLLVEPSNNDFSKVIQITNNITPSGRTPLAASIRKAGKVLRNIGMKTRIIIVSDGVETCGGNPVIEAKSLVQNYGIDIKLYVVGYNVGGSAKSQLESIAVAGNGKYFDVNNAIALNKAVNEIVSLENIRMSNFSSDGKIYTFHINFDTGSDYIKPKFLKSIKDYANYLLLNNYKVQIQGHTDSMSDEHYNQELSERRAKRVKEKLIEFGVPAERLSYIGYGEKKPIASNLTSEGRYKNRRVEAHIVGK